MKFYFKIIERVNNVYRTGSNIKVNTLLLLFMLHFKKLIIQKLNFINYDIFYLKQTNLNLDDNNLKELNLNFQKVIKKIEQ